MALVLSSAAATVTCSYTNMIPRLSGAAFASGYHRLSIHPNIVQRESTFLANSLNKLVSSDVASFSVFQHYKPLLIYRSTAVARGYLGNESGSAPENDNDDDSDSTSFQQDGSEMQLDSEFHGNTIDIQIEKIENNSRLIRSMIGVDASIIAVWNLLTDYERLADFIPGLAVSQLLEKKENYARLYQIGEQTLPFGLKFNAKATVDCFERDLEIFPGGCRRDIEFKMVEGDFEIFEGKWSVQQADGEDPTTTLSYIVHVKPKMWLPVQLIESRICDEIKRNLSCIREQAEKSLHVTNAVVQ